MCAPRSRVVGLLGQEGKQNILDDKWTNGDTFCSGDFLEPSYDPERKALNRVQHLCLDHRYLGQNPSDNFFEGGRHSVSLAQVSGYVRCGSS